MLKIDKLLLYFLPCLLFILPFYTSAEESNQQKIKKILTRSLILPGLGQLSEKQYLKGSLFLGSEIYCVIQALVNNKKGNDFYDLYKNSDDPEDVIRFRQETENYDTKRNLYLLASAVIWVVNLVDIYIHSKKKYKKKIRISLQQEGSEKIYLGFNISF